jgi:hypothetical protein
MTTLTVLALDPGGTTGWAMYRAQVLPGDYGPDNKLRNEYYDETFICGQMGPEDHHEELFGFLETQHTQEYHVIYESFEYRNKAREGLVLVSREYIGVVKLFGQQRGGVVVVKQGPATAMAFVKDAHLKKLGVWDWRMGHAMDAYRHLFYYLTQKLDRVDILERAWK